MSVAVSDPGSSITFTILLEAEGVVVTAEAPSAEQAVRFVCGLHDCEAVLASVWRQAGGRWSMTVHDLELCWSLEAPALARIMAPPDYQPQQVSVAASFG